MLCTQHVVTLVITLTNPSPRFPPCHTLEVLRFKASISQSNLHGHLTHEKRSTVLVDKEDMNVPKAQCSD